MFRLFEKLWLAIIVFVKGSPPETDELLDMRRIIGGMFPILAVGFVLTLVVCGNFWGRGAMWCLSCLSVGAAIGFLFGIPKTLQAERKGIATSANSKSPYRQVVNTNLEEISDWLTKIIVGLGLIQLGKIPGWIDSLASSFADSIEQTNPVRGVFGAIIVFFFVSGFLFGYLITRLFLQGALGRADRAAASPDEGAEPKQEGPIPVPATPPTPATISAQPATGTANGGTI